MRSKHADFDDPYWVCDYCSGSTYSTEQKQRATIKGSERRVKGGHSKEWNEKMIWGRATQLASAEYKRYWPADRLSPDETRRLSI
jgi:hypothetical protein